MSIRLKMCILRRSHRRRWHHHHHVLRHHQSHSREGPCRWKTSLKRPTCRSAGGSQLRSKRSQTRLGKEATRANCGAQEAISLLKAEKEQRASAETKLMEAKEKDKAVSAHQREVEAHSSTRQAMKEARQTWKRRERTTDRCTISTAKRERLLRGRSRARGHPKPFGGESRARDRAGIRPWTQKRFVGRTESHEATRREIQTKAITHERIVAQLNAKLKSITKSLILNGEKSHHSKILFKRE